MACHFRRVGSLSGHGRAVRRAGESSGARRPIGLAPPRWAETYGRVVETGEPVRMKEVELMLGRAVALNIFRLGEERSWRVAVLFTITPAAFTGARPGFRLCPAGMTGGRVSVAD